MPLEVGVGVSGNCLFKNRHEVREPLSFRESD